MDDRPNFIFIIADELRSDALGCYGNGLVKTPVMDEVASKGMLFSNNFTQHTVCTPARCSLLTGCYPHVTGHRSLWNLLKPFEPNLLRLLKEKGYHVYWNGWHNDVLNPEAFSLSVSESHKNGKWHFGKMRDSVLWRILEVNKDFKEDIEEHSDVAILTAAAERISGTMPMPFVMWLPLIGPHPPYVLPESWEIRCTAESVDVIGTEKDKSVIRDLLRKEYGRDKAVMGMLQEVRAVYLGMVSFLDWAVGRFWEAFKNSRYIDSTYLIFISDHGDYAGDYGLAEKWPSGMEDVLTHVPLIINGPDVKQGKKYDGLTESIDIPATVLDLANIEPNWTNFGSSLKTQLTEDFNRKHRDYIVCEGGYDISEPHCIEGADIHGGIKGKPKRRIQQEFPESVCRTIMIRSLFDKFVLRSNGTEEYFDLRHDPFELGGGKGSSAENDRKQKLKDELLAFFLRTSDITPFIPDPRHAVPEI